MIIVLIGTRAQIIKMAPVMLEMEKCNIDYTFVLTGQHKHTLKDMIDDFGLSTSPHFLYQGSEIDSIVKVPAWFVISVKNFLKIKLRKTTKGKTNKNILIVHGDTFSTLLGAIIAKLTGARLFHVEAGLRSYNFFHPFPEEITRILTFHLSDVAFCPGEYALNNMAKYKIKKVNIEQNTLLDATRFVLNKFQGTNDEADYCVCSIHRFENIFSKKRLMHIVFLLKRISRHINVKFVMHPSTKKRMIKLGLFDELKNIATFQLMDRMSYTKFIHQLAGAKFVVTDGGSNQEELYYMGIPTLLMRKQTERQEGMSSTAVLSNYDVKIIDNFINTYTSYQRGNKLINQDITPSTTIVNYIQNVTQL
jgi:UDP-N-acetylglucosamine 2-epimerase (non-hydrolysing)